MSNGVWALVTNRYLIPSIRCTSELVSPPDQNTLSRHPKQGSAPDVRADERAARLLSAHGMSVVDMIQVLYPSLYSLHDLPSDIADTPPPSAPMPTGVLEGSNAIAAGEGRGVAGIWGRAREGVEIPKALPPTSEKLSSEGVFLLDNGEELLLYVGRSVSGEVMQELFGVDASPGEDSVRGFSWKMSGMM